MKRLKSDLNRISKGLRKLIVDVELMRDKIHLIEKKHKAKLRLAKASLTAPKVIRAERGKPATDIFLTVVARSRKGATVRYIQEKTGFDEKKIRNLIHRAKTTGKIKNLRRGVYVKA